MRMNEIKIVEQLDRGLAYAEACFETFRVVQGLVFQREKHQKRLQNGLRTYGLTCPYDALKTWFDQAIAAAASQGDDMLVRITVSAGPADWGLLLKDSELHVQVQVMPSMTREPVHLQIVTWPFPLREKQVKYTSDYAESLRAIQTWNLENSMQALVCSEYGYILSTLTANIMIYRHEQWYTPMGTGILSGIIQQFLLQHKLVVACECPVSWLDDCDAIALSNSGIFVRAVDSMNGRALHISHPSLTLLIDALNACEGVPEL